MKIALTLSLLATASAFAPTPLFGLSARRVLFAEPESTTEAAADFVQAAFEASETYGPTSKEARLAWEAVEDLNVRNEQSDAYTGGNLSEDCSVDEPSAECLDYGEKMEELNKLLKLHRPMITEVKRIAEEIQSIKLKASEIKPGSDSPELRAALDNARKTSKEFGATSSQARVAWTEVEEIASASNSLAIGSRLDEECLVETIEACEAIEEVQRVLNLGKSTSRYSG